MKLRWCRHVVCGFLVALGTVALCSSASAQTPPRPAVDVRQLPAMWNSVWPADFNRDGRTDLVAGERGPLSPPAFGRVVVRLGSGDGTFGSAIPSGVNGAPVTTGDFNRDGRQDVVVVGANGAMSILPGRGDGRFDSPRTLDSVEDFKFALSGDFNADGVRDLVIGHGRTVEINPGLGDFTFGPQMVLPPGNEFGVNAAIAGDFNGDSRPDLAVAQLFGSVFVYLNRGGLLFDASEIFIANEEMYGITTGDLDRDGDLDLIVPHTMQSIDWSEGGVELLKGNGNGTFAAPVTYHTGVDGPYTVVVGQFNGDSLLDVAVGSRSWTFIDQNGPTFHYWDSVSIFPGRGDGTLGAAAVFRLDTVPASPVGSLYVDTHHALKTSDVNGDGRTDLITSPGAIVLTRAAAANRPPRVNAGPDRSVDPDFHALLSPAIVEPDWDWLEVEWRNASRVVARTPSFFHNTFQTETVTVTVRDQRGGTGTDSVVVYVPPGEYFFLGIDEPDLGETVSTMSPFTIEWSSGSDPRIASFDLWSSSNDGQSWTRIAECANLAATAQRCRWNVPAPVTDTARIHVRAYEANGTLLSVGASERFKIVPGPRTSLPDRWFHDDVGAVGAEGDATFDGSAFTVRGSGADIWGTADEFHWTYTFVDGDFDFVARVASVQNVNQWTKAGIMLRNFGGGASAAHASLFATPSTVKGIALQTRTNTGGASTQAASRPLAPPIWLKAMRRGAAVYFAYRKAATDRWTLLPIVRPVLGSTIQVGLAVSSHVDGIVATARFDNVSIGEAIEAPTWQDRDIGAVGAAGRRIPSSDPSSLSLEGSGADIWGTADAFHYEYRQMSGDGVIAARVFSVENTHAWAKAGVMFRESLTADSKHAFALVSAGKGMAVQSRESTGGISVSTTPRAGTAPKWIRLERLGNTFTAHTTSDGITWALLGSVTVPMNIDIFVGLAVTSHASGTLATAAFDDVVVTRTR